MCCTRSCVKNKNKKCGETRGVQGRRRERETAPISRTIEYTQRHTVGVARKTNVKINWLVLSSQVHNASPVPAPPARPSVKVQGLAKAEGSGVGAAAASGASTHSHTALAVDRRPVVSRPLTRWTGRKRNRQAHTCFYLSQCESSPLRPTSGPMSCAR